MQAQTDIFTVLDYIDLTPSGNRHDIIATINAGPDAIRAHWADLGAIWADERTERGFIPVVDELDDYEVEQVAAELAATWGLVQDGEIDGWPVYRVDAAS